MLEITLKNGFKLTIDEVNLSIKGKTCRTCRFTKLHESEHPCGVCKRNSETPKQAKNKYKFSGIKNKGLIITKEEFELIEESVGVYISDYEGCEGYPIDKLKGLDWKLGKIREEKFNPTLKLECED